MNTEYRRRRHGSARVKGATGAAVISVAISSMFVLAGMALADSPSIAGAPSATYGQQEFGNTASVPPDSNGYFSSYWTLNVVAGDRITIDWAAATNTDNSICVYPVGTNDYNVGNTDCYAGWQSLNGNGANQLTFSARRSGVMPLVFEAEDYYGGPYHFIAYDAHAAVLTMPNLSSVSSHGKLHVGVFNADGSRVTDPSMLVVLQITTGQKWTNIGHASPSNGVAAVSYSIPSKFDGQRARLRAVSFGGGYQSEKVVRKVQVRR